jgi:hypothetical protein
MLNPQLLSGTLGRLHPTNTGVRNSFHKYTCGRTWAAHNLLALDGEKVGWSEGSREITFVRFASAEYDTLPPLERERDS